MYIVMTLVFVILRLGPLDPAQYILGDYATAETLQKLRESMELNLPIYVQYLNFISRMLRGDFGVSFFEQADRPFSIGGCAALHP